ncbi:acetyltransferase [Erwinia pyri]|uniref:Acetyltransferase n=1 Tax=Erwinia pyri TaxID=3062598 RepID=A0AA50DLW1_9GAMM|nr:acetyltransferase [Erwinia sp. DE2]WLS80304.1 acetyltransferase [Erwinia sp. DE2]
MNKKIIVIGGGGHASVLVDILHRLELPVFSFISPSPPANKIIFNGILHWLSDDILTSLPPDEYILVNGIGSMPGSVLREKVANAGRKLGYEFMNIISPDAYVSSFATLSEGVQIMGRAIVQPGCVIGQDVIVNSGAIIEHDCTVGDYSHISPGAVVCGNAHIGERVHVGANASVIQGVSVARGSVIGAGAIVTKNLDSAAIVYPARPFNRSI